MGFATVFSALWIAVPVALALVVTATLFWRNAWSNKARNVVREALDALRALVLPVAVVLLFGALTTPKPILQVVVGCALGALVAEWWHAKEWKRSFGQRRAEAGLQQGGVSLLGMPWGFRGLASAGVVLVVVWIALATLPTYDDNGGFSSALALTALLVWALALLARLIGYAIGASRWRILPVVLAIALLLRALMAVGILGFEFRAAAFPSLRLMLLLLGLGFVVSVIAEVWKGRTSDNAIATTPAAIGLGLSVASMCAIAVAIVYGAFEIAARSGSSTKGLSDAAVVQQPFSTWSDKALALAFLPVLRFDRRARWTPELVNDDYFKRVHLVDLDARAQDPGHHPQPADLKRECSARHPDPCLTLTLGCPRADTDDDKPCSQERTAGLPDTPRQDGGVYVRVARKGQAFEDEPDPFESFGPPAMTRDLTTMVQYWFFYDYDEWVAPVLGGRIVQRHEGDWEAVTIGLAGDHPLFVGFSEHCGGIWQPWSKRVSLMNTANSAFNLDVDFLVDPDYRQARQTAGPATWSTARNLPTHATVQVAVGSQANYPPRLSSRAPDWSSCKGIPREAVSLISYVSNLRDRTGSDLTWVPKTIALVDRHTRPMTFPGTWGSKDSMQFVTLRDDPDAPGGRGPATPSRQPLWLRPVRQIFCSAGWHGDGQSRDRSCRT
jgi:hypothetical protein